MSKNEDCKKDSEAPLHSELAEKLRRALNAPKSQARVVDWTTDSEPGSYVTIAFNVEGEEHQVGTGPLAWWEAMNVIKQLGPDAPADWDAAANDLRQEWINFNSYAKESFRNIADQDYIAARSAAIHGLWHNHMWCALQCFEKYLKAILLFNQRPSLKFSHDLDSLFKEVAKIDGLDFRIDGQVVCEERGIRDPKLGRLGRYLQHISLYGLDRYHTHPTSAPRWPLRNLDQVVWEIRRYCQPLAIFRDPDSGFRDGLVPEPKGGLLPDALGYLESVLSSDASTGLYNRSRIDTVQWDNPYFGSADRNPDTALILEGSSSNPVPARRRGFARKLAVMVKLTNWVEPWYHLVDRGFQIKELIALNGQRKLRVKKTDPPKSSDDELRVDLLGFSLELQSGSDSYVTPSLTREDVKMLESYFGKEIHQKLKKSLNEALDS